MSVEIRNIGLPPMSSLSSSNAIRDNMLILCSIQPSVAQWAEGLKAFRLLNAFSSLPVKGAGKCYIELLNENGFTYNSSNNAVNLFCTIDSMPAETFSNEYGDTFLSKIGDVVSEAAGDISQMTGGRTAGAIYNNLTSSFQQSSSETLKMLGGLMQGAGEGAKGIMEGLNQATTNMGKDAGVLTGAANWAGKLLAGQRVDFPSVWKNSGFQPSYSVNVKLFNPYPGSDEATEKYIIGPLTAILLLMLPYGDGESYSWPFFCRVDAPGIFSLPSAGISGVSVTKGGDGTQVSYRQALGQVDVKIDFQSLFSTMVTGSYDPKTSSRLCLERYLDNLRARKIVKSIYGYETTKDKVTEQLMTANSRVTQVTTQTQSTSTFQLTSSDGTAIYERPGGDMNGDWTLAKSLPKNSSFSPASTLTASQVSALKSSGSSSSAPWVA